MLTRDQIVAAVKLLVGAMVAVAVVLSVIQAIVADALTTFVKISFVGVAALIITAIGVAWLVSLRKNHGSGSITEMNAIRTLPVRAQLSVACAWLVAAVGTPILLVSAIVVIEQERDLQENQSPYAAPEVSESAGTAKEPLDKISEVVPECSEDGGYCEIVSTVHLGTGVQEVVAYGVNSLKGPLHYVKSGVVILNEDGSLRWHRMINAGYGLGSLDLDATNHLFALFYLTNHTTMTWVLDVSSEGVQDFGTTSAQLSIDDWGVDNMVGERVLYSYREDWLAYSDKDTTMRDVYEWDGSVYVHERCEKVLTWTTDAMASGDEIVDSFAATSPQCRP